MRSYISSIWGVNSNNRSENFRKLYQSILTKFNSSCIVYCVNQVEVPVLTLGQLVAKVNQSRFMLWLQAGEVDLPAFLYVRSPNYYDWEFRDSEYLLPHINRAWQIIFIPKNG